MRRFSVAVSVALLAGVWVFWRYAGAPYGSPQYLPSDYDQLWFGARELFAGRDPYLAIGPGRRVAADFPLYFPLPALILVAPLTILSLETSRALFASISAGVLAWVVCGDERGRWPMLLSVPFLFGILRGQWAPLLLAGFICPPTAVALSAKPTLGAAVFLARPSRWAVAWSAVILAISFVAMPTWVGAWGRAVTASAALIPAIHIPLGWIPLLALTRWRFPESRLIAFTACVPQTFVHYEAIYAFAAARTRVETMVLALLSGIAYGVAARTELPTDIQAAMQQRGPWLFALLYAPAIALLWRRAHTRAIPVWAERWASLLPTWLRGQATQPELDGTRDHRT